VTCGNTTPARIEQRAQPLLNRIPIGQSRYVREALAGSCGDAFIAAAGPGVAAQAALLGRCSGPSSPRALAPNQRPIRAGDVLTRILARIRHVGATLPTFRFQAGQSPCSQKTSQRGRCLPVARGCQWLSSLSSRLSSIPRAGEGPQVKVQRPTGNDLDPCAPGLGR
jgi:hypothetical protein